MNNQTTITVEKMATYLSISKTMAYELVHSRDFYPAFRIGRKILVNVDKLKQWIEEQGQKAV